MPSEVTGDVLITAKQQELELTPGSAISALDKSDC